MQKYQYTIVPMIAKSDENRVNPTEYLEMMNALGSTGYELVSIHNDCLIFKKLCSSTEKLTSSTSTV